MYALLGVLLDIAIGLLIWGGLSVAVVALRRRIKHGPRRPLTPDQYAYQNAYAWREHNETNMR